MDGEKMKEWFISDSHFGHGNIIGYENRPFRDSDHMTKELIKRWNSKVGKQDIVFHMGDLTFLPKAQTIAILKALRGRIVLIKGNHDTHSNKWYRDVGVHEVIEWPIIIHRFLILSHEPMYLSENTPYRNIHGHTHSKNYISKKFFNASVEAINYTPVDWEHIAKYIDIGDIETHD